MPIATSHYRYEVYYKDTSGTRVAVDLTPYVLSDENAIGTPRFNRGSGISTKSGVISLSLNNRSGVFNRANPGTINGVRVETTPGAPIVIRDSRDNSVINSFFQQKLETKHPTTKGSFPIAQLTGIGPLKRIKDYFDKVYVQRYADSESVLSAEDLFNLVVAATGWPTSWGIDGLDPQEVYGSPATPLSRLQAARAGITGQRNKRSNIDEVLKTIGVAGLSWIYETPTLGIAFDSYSARSDRFTDLELTPPSRGRHLVTEIDEADYIINEVEADYTSTSRLPSDTVIFGSDGGDIVASLNLIPAPATMSGQTVRGGTASISLNLKDSNYPEADFVDVWQAPRLAIGDYTYSAFTSPNPEAPVGERDYDIPATIDDESVQITISSELTSGRTVTVEARCTRNDVAVGVTLFALRGTPNTEVEGHIESIRDSTSIDIYNNRPMTFPAKIIALVDDLGRPSIESASRINQRLQALINRSSHSPSVPFLRIEWHFSEQSDFADEAAPGRWIPVTVPFYGIVNEPYFIDRVERQTSTNEYIVTCDLSPAEVTAQVNKPTDTSSSRRPMRVSTSSKKGSFALGLDEDNQLPPTVSRY